MSMINRKKIIMVVVTCMAAVALIAGVAIASAYSLGSNAAVAQVESNETDESSDTCEGRPGGRHGVMREHRDEIHSVIAEALGITTDELETERSEGKTVAQIAEEKGISTDQVVEALTNKLNEIVDVELAEGNLTEEEAQDIKDKVPEKAQEMVEKGPKEGGRRHGPEQDTDAE